jgi:hypothetical protein
MQADYQENVGTSTSHNPMGLHGLLQGSLYLYLCIGRNGVCDGNVEIAQPPTVTVHKVVTERNLSLA